jgi:type II secretory pathway component GspD/PulD (secretin)
VIKWAFNKKDKETHEVELMVFLRPRVIRSPSDADAVLREVDEKAPLVKQWQDDSHPAKPVKKTRK